MEQIEQLFRHFMREQEILGRNPAILKSYCDSFRWFRKLMPDVTISNFNSEKIIEFTIRLCNFRYWSHSINDFVSIKASTILNFMNYLWSFLIWLKENQNTSGLIEKSENQSSKNTMNKLLFLSIYRQKYDSIISNSVEQKSKDCYLANDLLILQLSRRYNSFFTLSNNVFFIGIADYVKFIFRKRQLTDIIKHHILEKEKHDFETSEKLDEIWQNSVWGSWFDLELVYLIIYKMREVIHDFSDDLDVKYYLKSCYKEMKNIIDNSTDIELIYFKRPAYNVDIIRVHNYILETLEIDNEIQESEMKRMDKIRYKFNGYGIPGGELIIREFAPIQFTKNPAVVIQFYYLNRDNDEYFSYKDFNEFLGSGKRNLTSNEFRLLIDSINKRVRNNTSGIMKKIIIKGQKNIEGRETNRYKFINLK